MNRKTSLNKNKHLGYTIVELLVVIAIMSILLLIAIPSLVRYLDNSKEDRANTLAILLNSTIQREFVDLNGLVLDLNKVNAPNSSIIQEIKSNENLQPGATVKFYSAGYENDTAVNTVITQEISSSSTTDFVGIILPDNNPTALFSNTPTINLNKPIKIVIKFANDEAIYVYENGINVTSDYITP